MALDDVPEDQLEKLIEEAKRLSKEWGEPTYIVRDTDTGELYIVGESQISKDPPQVH